MPDISVEHRLNCSEETFWSKVFFDLDYNRRLSIDCLNFTDWREIRREERDQRLHRVVEACPPMGDFPGPLKSLFGEGSSYEERGIFDLSSRRYTAQIVPNRLANRIRVEVEVYAVPDGAQHCRRISSAKMSANIFGVGGLLEKMMLSDFRKSHEKSAEFTNAFIGERRLGG